MAGKTAPAKKKPAAKKPAAKKPVGKTPAKKRAKKGQAVKKKWDDKPKNKLVAFWVKPAYLKQMDKALVNQGKFDSRGAFLRDATDKMIERNK